MFGTLSQSEIEALIKREVICRLGCHADGLTYIVPISYAYDGEYIYGHTFDGLKVDMMRKNPKICFQVDDMRNMANWQSVIAWGEFEELKEGEERDKAIEALVQRTLPLIHSETMHITPQWPFPSANNEVVIGIIFRVKLTNKTGRYEKSDESNFFAS